MSILEKKRPKIKEHYTDFTKSPEYSYLQEIYPTYKATFYFKNKFFKEVPHKFPRVGISLKDFEITFAKHENDNLLEEAIKDAEYIIELPGNWDEEGALPISRELFDTAVQFLRDYSLFLATTKGINLEIPEINPCKDGTIDLSWHTKSARLLINMRWRQQDGYIAYFYGDLYNNKMPIKGNVPTSEFFEPLAVWMKYLV